MQTKYLDYFHEEIVSRIGYGIYQKKYEVNNPKVSSLSLTVYLQSSFFCLSSFSNLTLLKKKTLETVEVQTKYLDYFMSNIQSFGLSLICVVSDFYKTGKRTLK